MQSRLIDNTARTSIRVLFAGHHRLALQRAFCSASWSHTADPAIHSGEREAGPEVHRGEPQGTTSAADGKTAETEHMPKDEFFKSPKSPYDSSAKLKSSGVNQRLDPTFQQKRNQGSVTLEDVSCAGLDGTPWPKDKRSKEEKLEDEREYYQHHKASPLSELKIADSRKPITRATDGTADSGAGRDVIGWLPEQLDTAEDSLRRATEIWKQNAMRGDPDAPHSRVLRALRGEDF